jgi:Mlc titration factor MtfA (ptsG expression regulator)
MGANTLLVLERDVAFYSKLAESDRARFVEKVERFVTTKQIRGERVVVDHRVRVLVGAAACRLSLNLVAEEYRRLANVDIFPTGFDRPGGAAVGVAFEASCVWLALDALEVGLRDPTDGDNVGYHEFAHVLDASDGLVDGVPPLLLEPRLRGRWVRVMENELSKRRALHHSGGDALLPEDACLNEAELFAYATEAFFERPRELRAYGPELFELLTKFYRQNPG